jgi:hypothetical protein
VGSLSNILSFGAGNWNDDEKGGLPFTTFISGKLEDVTLHTLNQSGAESGIYQVVEGDSVV